MDRLDPEIWADLCNILNDRFSRDIPTTEDSVRYCFFHVLICARSVCHPNDMLLEYTPPPDPKIQPDTVGRLFKSAAERKAEYDAIPRIKIDTVILRGKGDPAYALEFKFHRKSNTATASTTHAGQLFHDFFRQAEFKKTYGKTTCYVVYVGGVEMQGYFQNARNVCKTWYELKPGESISLDKGDFSRIKDTFRREMGTVVPCVIKRAARYTMDSGYVLVADVVDPYLD